jgi:predicted metal-dependent hydrolase
MKYLIKIPNKPDREIDMSNYNIDIISKRVAEQNGTLEPIKEFIPTPAIMPEKTREDLPISWSEALKIYQFIKEKHFPYVVVNSIEYNTRLRRRLGRAWPWKGKIELSYQLLTTHQHYLHQVIWHEILHLKFPQEGHNGIHFRCEEMNNPYRIKKTRRLTQVS